MTLDATELSGEKRGQWFQVMTRFLIVLSLGFGLAAQADTPQKIVDIPTRPGVTQRFILLAPEKPRATVILFAGGHGGLQIDSAGKFGWGGGNFLVRSRRLFAERGLAVAVIDAPSDRQKPPYLAGFRQTPSHVTDVKAVIARLRQEGSGPIWLVGTSFGTYSAAHVAIELPQDGADGVVLTSTTLSHNQIRPVPDFDLWKIKVPVLVVHHEQDLCPYCAYRDMPRLMDKLGNAGKRALLTFTGGRAEGDPCDAFSYHGYNGIEKDVVQKIADWVLSN
jgi:pimeloyl-ACP methyl ester carboxylesterase